MTPVNRIMLLVLAKCEKDVHNWLETFDSQNITVKFLVNEQDGEGWNVESPWQSVGLVKLKYYDTHPNWQKIRKGLMRSGFNL